MSKQLIDLGSALAKGDSAKIGGRKINENFTEVYDNIDLLVADSSIYNKITASTGYSLIGQNLTVNANWQWLLSNIAKTNPANVVINIPFSAAGKSRIEYIVPNNSNGFTRISGVESTTIPVAPQIPNKDMYVTWYTVDDGSIGVPAPTFNGEKYIEKREKQPYQVYKTGEINDTYIDDFYYGYLNFRDDDGISSVTNLKSIRIYTNVHLYSGKEILVKNSQTTDITIFHLTGLPGFRFSFPNAQNLVLKPNEIIRFSMKVTDPSSGILEYVGRLTEVPTVAVADVVGLPAALATKVTQTEIDALGTQLLGGAPADGNTLKELNDKILAVQAIIGGSTANGDSLVNTVAELLQVFSTYSEGVDLVTLLAGKVNSTDIYNALDCIVAGKVLDARQGKVLNDLIVALTTVVGDKVDKVAGERLINAGEIVKLSNTSGTNTGDQTLILPVTETGTSFSLTDAYNGKVVILTASCTVTIPNGLIAGFEVSLITLTGVTLTVALGGSVVLFNNVGLTMAEKLSCTIKNRTATNNYITAGSL